MEIKQKQAKLLFCVIIIIIIIIIINNYNNNKCKTFHEIELIKNINIAETYLLLCVMYASARLLI